MIKSISIENFKNLAKLDVSGLSRITLIGGENNCGKSTLLEAISLLCNPTSEKEIFSALFRTMSPQTATHPWPLVFYNYNTKNTISLSSPSIRTELTISTTLPRDISFIPSNPKFDIKDEDTVFFQTKFEDITIGYQVTYNKTPAISIPTGLKPINTLLVPTKISLDHQFINSMYTKLVLDNSDGKKMVIDLIKHFEKNISNFEILTPGTTPTLHFVMESGFRVSSLTMGEGIQRLTLLLLNMINLRDGILLIDEIENGLHHSGQVQFWVDLSKLARHLNCQIIATTHSYECLQAAIAGCKEHPEDLTYFRLDRLADGSTRAPRYPYELLESAIDTDWEIR